MSVLQQKEKDSFFLTFVLIHLINMGSESVDHPNQTSSIVISRASTLMTQQNPMSSVQILYKVQRDYNTNLGVGRGSVSPERCCCQDSVHSCNLHRTQCERGHGSQGGRFQATRYSRDPLRNLRTSGLGRCLVRGQKA